MSTTAVNTEDTSSSDEDEEYVPEDSKTKESIDSPKKRKIEFETTSPKRLNFLFFYEQIRLKTNENIESETKNVNVNEIWQQMKQDTNVIPPQKDHSLTIKSQNQEKKLQSPKKGGLDNLINSLGKKKQASTLEKTKQDWVQFKQKQGIEFESELQKHVKSSNSFLEKQAFLQRTDLREFEKEKSVRLKQTTNSKT